MLFSTGMTLLNARILDFAEINFTLQAQVGDVNYFTNEVSHNFFVDDILYGSVDWLYTYVEGANIFNIVFFSLDWGSFTGGDTFDFFFYFY